jgi:hypothetical protein
MNENQFGGSFWITITGLLLTFIGTIATFCLKSKCKSCSICFGLIKVERDVQAEIDEERLEIENGINPFQQNK